MFKKILVIIFFLAFVLRFWGIHPGFPLYHPDEPQIYSRALLILQNREEDLGYWGYPALVPMLNAVFYATFFIPLTLLFKVVSTPSILNDFVSFNYFLQKYAYGVREINVMYWGRFVSAFFGSLTVVLIYFLAKKYFNKLTGLLAAFFLTINYRHVLGSHFSLPDIFNSFFILIPLFFSIKILSEDKTKNYIWAGITSGLSMSVKLSPFILISSFVAHLFSDKKVISRKSLSQLFFMLLAFIMTVLVLNVFHIFHFSDLVHDMEKLNKRYLVGSFEIFLYPYAYLFTTGIGSIVSTLSAIGLFIGFIKNFKKTLILFSPVFLIFFSLTFYSIGGVYVRNFIVVIPIIMIFAAVGGLYLLKKNIFLGILILILASLNPIKEVLLLDFNYSKQWNIENLKTYFQKNIHNSLVYSNPWFAAYINDSTNNFKEWNYENVFNLSELQEERADYLILDTDEFEALTTWWMSIRGLNSPLVAPKNIINSTFPLSSLRELFNYKVQEFTKPVHVPETNFFIVKIPTTNVKGKSENFFYENFDKSIDWKLFAPDGKIIPNTMQIFNKNCGGCIKIGQINDNDSKDDYLLSTGLSRSFSVRSALIKIDEKYEYLMSIDVWNEKKIIKNDRDGFVKIELYKTENDAVSGKVSDLVFVSSRYFYKDSIKQKLTKPFYVPEGFSYAVISLQVDRNANGDFYFDNLKVEKIIDKNNEYMNIKQMPEEFFIKDSIL